MIAEGIAETLPSQDVLVVGSGAAGTVAALRAASAGRSVTILEKADLLGGTTAAGGGVLWIPDNEVMREEGWHDDAVSAADYLRAVSHGEMPEEDIAWYVRTGPRAVSWLRANSRVAWRALSRPDYHGRLPGAAAGGRGLDNEAFDFAGCSGLAEVLRPPTYLPLLTMRERDELEGRAPDAGLLARRAESGVRTMGGALAGSLLASALDAGVVVSRRSRVAGLARSGDLWEVAVDVDGSRRRVTARAVVLATGGFEWDSALVGSLLPFPVTPISAPSNEGDGLYLALGVGAGPEATTAIWGVPVISPPEQVYDGHPGGRMGNVEMTLPGSITVDSSGRRFVNEAVNYHDASRVFGNVDPSTGRRAHDPAWLVFDARYARTYSIGGSPSGAAPDWAVTAGSIRELAERIGIDAAGLEETVERFNGFAESGVDEDFGRGANPEDRHLGDPWVKPNPCLAPLDEGPFSAIRIRPGVLGTAGGIRVDRDGRVLDRHGVSIPGLYSAGNCSATVFRGAYPGGGATLGPAITRGFAVGKCLAEG